MARCATAISPPGCGTGMPGEPLVALPGRFWRRRAGLAEALGDLAAAIGLGRAGACAVVSPLGRTGSCGLSLWT